MAGWLFWLRCEMCGAEKETLVMETSLHRLSSGGFSPLRCHECGALSAKPGPRPWVLGPNDRKFLRGMRISPE